MRTALFMRESSTRALKASGRAVFRGLGLFVLVVALVVPFAPGADAHTDFEYSDPADGAIIAEPVSQVRVRFTAESLVAGDGFVVLTPTGEIIAPEIVVSEDQREFTLLFEPALTAGDVGVQWSVRAGDAHPTEGAFSFTTTAPAPDVAREQVIPAGDAEPVDSTGLPEEELASPTEPDETTREIAESPTEELV